MRLDNYKVFEGSATKAILGILKNAPDRMWFPFIQKLTAGVLLP